MTSRPLDEPLHFSSHEYDEFCAFLQSSCGIDLGHNKQYLVATRVRRIMVSLNLTKLAQLTELIKKADQRQVRQSVIDAMTTNETFWFRDNYPFEYFGAKLLPRIQAQKPGSSIKIWSAACSYGQEPYSLSMVVEEFNKRPAAKPLAVDILATDLSSAVLEHARTGVYDRISIARGLTPDRKSQFFEAVDEDNWRLKSSVKHRVQFRPLNLQDSFYLLGKFDVIFCRNVLIYFSQELKAEILRKLHGQLHTGGFLFLGSSEGLTGVAELFEMVDCAPGLAYKAV
ncbi:MAG: protein-glutamate O-methyltransferase CheR [Marinagarivorans sp.]